MNVFRIINGDMHFRELFRGSTIAFVFRLVSALASYVFFYFLAQLYGPKGVGVFTTSWTILMISSVVGKMGFDTSIVKFIAESAGSRSYLRMRKIYRSGLRIILLSASVVAIILMALSGYVTGWFYETVSDNWVVILVGLSVIPYSLMSYNAESLKGLKRILPFSVHQNVTIYFGALVLLFIVNSFYGHKEAAIIALVIILLILMTSSFITLRIYLKRYPNHDSHYSPEIPGPRKIINTTLPMMMTNSLFLVMNWTDVLMLANMTSDAAVGIYNVSLKIAALNSIVLIAINSIAMPKYAELFKVNKIRFKQVVKAVSFISFLVSFPVFLIILFFPQFILGLFGHEFQAGSYAMIVLSVGQLFAAFSGSTVILMNMTGKEKAVLYLLIISVVINLLLNYYLIPVLGINGAAFATSFSTILLNLLAVISIYRYTGFLTYPIFPLGQIKYYIRLLFDKEH